MDFRVSNHCFPDPFSLSHATLQFLICVFLHLNKLNTLAEFSLRWFPGWNRIAAFLSSSPPPSAPSRPRPPLPHGLCHRAPVCVGACLCVIIGGVKTGRSVPSGSTRWSQAPSPSPSSWESQESQGRLSTFPVKLLRESWTSYHEILRTREVPFYI